MLWLDSMLYHSEWANHNFSSVFKCKPVPVPFLQQVELDLSVAVQCCLFFKEYLTNVVLQEGPELVIVLDLVEVISKVTLTPNGWLPIRLWVTFLQQDCRYGQNEL